MTLNLGLDRILSIITRRRKMSKKRTVEVFTAGCPVCQPTVDLVNELACDSCEVTVYDLNKGCDTMECREKAEKYGITKLPAIAVNGSLLDCCKTGSITKDALIAAGIGQA